MFWELSTLELFTRQDAVRYVVFQGLNSTIHRHRRDTSYFKQDLHMLFLCMMQIEVYSFTMTYEFDLAIGHLGTAAPTARISPHFSRSCGPKECEDFMLPPTPVAATPTSDRQAPVRLWPRSRDPAMSHLLCQPEESHGYNDW